MITDAERVSIIKSYPSICHTCKSARKPASDENRGKGYVGCAEYARKENYDYVGVAKEIATGWVDLKTKIFGDKSGIISNFQLLTLEVESCNKFEVE